MHPNPALSAQDAIITDSHTMEAKKTIMKGWKVNAMLNSVSKVSAFIAGPLFAWGVIEAIKYGAKAAAATAATSTAGTAAAATAAATIALPTVLTILAVGAVFSAIAITSDYLATRKGQSTYFDNQEAISQSTARNLVKEMEAHKVCITNRPEYESNQRADGKAWTQAVAGTSIMAQPVVGDMTARVNENRAAANDSQIQLTA